MTSYFKIATVQETATSVLWFFEIKSVIKTQLCYRAQYGEYPPSDNAITFGDGYSMMKQLFTYQKGQIFITAEYGGQKALSPLEKSKEKVQKRMSGVV
jgi:hypothetical protein